MRLMIIFAGAALVLGGCGSEEAADNEAQPAESLTADNIVANDTTAIDAATNQAAQMAAEANLSLNLGEPDANEPAPANEAVNNSD